MATPYPDRVDTRQPPDKAEERLLGRLDDIEDEGRLVRDKWAPPADIDSDLTLFRTGGGPHGKKYFTANFIEAFVDRMVAQLTDNRPFIRIEPRKAGLKDVAFGLDRIAKVLWEEADMQRQAFKLCHLAATTRSAGLYTGYDPSTDEILLEPIRIDQVSLDPKIQEAARVSRGDYLFIRRIMATDELVIRFPGRGASVEPDAALSDMRPSEAGGATASILGGLRRVLVSPLSGALGRADRRVSIPRAEITECWIRDWRKTTDGALMFPGGRLILRSKDLVLWDGPNPYWDGRWPLDWLDWGVDPKHPWGRSEPDRLRHIQLPFNQLMDGLVRNQLVSNVLTLVADYDAFPPEMWKKLQKLDDTLILRKQNRNATAVLTAPPEFGADKLNIARQMYTMAQMLTGVTDVTMGETPGSLQSGLAIEGLQEGANLMTRSRASRLEDLYERVGQKLIARIFQFWTTDRVADLLGPTKAAEDYGHARQEMLFEKDAAGKLQSTNYESRSRSMRDFRFTIAPGSSAAGSRVARARLMMEMAKAGFAAGEDVLAAADIPEPREVMARAQAEAALRAQAGIPQPGQTKGSGGGR